MQTTSNFDIRNFTQLLTPVKGGKYICCNCNEPKLGIASSGKYQCWGCQDTKAIARILTEPEREEKRRQQESERIGNSKSQQERVSEWLEGSAVSEAITAVNLKHIEDNLLIARLLGWNWYSGSPGWYVCSCDPITGSRTNQGQFKPDIPISLSEEKDPQKYITFPKGGKGDNRLAAVYLVLTLDDWLNISERVGIPVENSDIDESRDDLGFWKWVLNHPEIPIVVTEGIKKEGCLLSLGWVAISVTGVWSAQLDKGKKLHKNLAPFIVPGRRIYLAFDADVLVKEGVESALRQLGHLIKREKSEVFICQWSLDMGKGADDFVVGGGNFQAVVKEAIAYSDWLKSLQPDNGGKDGGSGSGSGDGHGGDGRGGNQPDPDDKHPEAFYRDACEYLSLDFENCVTAQTFDNWTYRSEFGADEGDWRVIDAAFYKWDKQSGYWSHQPDNRINTLIADAGSKAFKVKYTKEFGWQASWPYATNSHKESSFKYCRSRLERPEPLPNNTHLRAFKNCVVDLRTGARMPHDKEYFLTSIIPHDYQPGRQCPEAFRQFVADSFGQDMLPIIRAFTSMFLDPTAPYGRFPHLIGKSGGGKGTLGRFWNSLFGEDGASSGDFSNLSSAESRHQYLTGKSIFSIPDAGGYVSGLRAFYELVDNGGLSGRALFNPVGYFKTWNARFWVASVDHLQIENAGDGWARRAYPIPVRSRTVKPDPDLRLKLEQCKADVISWALAMPRAERDSILLSPPTNERVINLTLDSALYGDSTKSFVDLCLRPSTEAGFVPNHILHSWYVSYCREHGYAALGMSRFISHLKTILPQNFVDRHWTEMKGGKRDRVSAHWEFIAPVPNAFVKGEVEIETDPFDGRRAKNNPEWTCIKAVCEEGGLMDFEDFWNPPQPPPEDSDNKSSNGYQPQPPSPTPQPTKSAKSVQSVQGVQKNTESLKQRNSGGVQGVQGVQGIGSDKEKNAVCVDQKIEASNEVDFSSTPSTVGGQTECKLDSFKVEQEPLNHAEVSQPTQVQQDVTVHTEVTQDVTEAEADPFMTEEDLADIADSLIRCPDPQTLAILRDCWTPQAMNAACKRLSSERHSQIKEWVISLNQAASQVDAVHEELAFYQRADGSFELDSTKLGGLSYG
jgi:phage/plasmid-associated DNA primase